AVDRVRLKDTRSVGWCQIRLKAHAPLHRLSREPNRSNWKRHIRTPIRALATALDEYDMALVATLAHPPDLDEGIANIIPGYG
ncbi:MAG: hypothetical protein JZD41_07120, partial [Thermoproteus sp.]|nr:hypothetical protein [Thermoproteus sp.]